MSIEAYFEQLFHCFEESGFPQLKEELQNALVSFGNGDITMDQFYAQYEDIVNNRFKPVVTSSKRLKKAQAQAPAPPKQEIKMVTTTTPHEILMRYFYETVLWGVQEVAAYERETCGRPLSRTTAPVIAEKQRDEEERLKRKRDGDEQIVVVDKDDIALSMAKQLKPKSSSSVVAKRRKLRKDTLAKQEEQERKGKLIVVTPALLNRGIEWCVMKHRLPPMHRILQKYF
jgi:hypothetical protein